MKKFLSLFLVLTMVLSMLTLPTFAEEVGDTTPTSTPTNTPNSAMEITEDKITGTETRNGQEYDTVSYNGKTYLVVRNADQFLAMDETNDAGTAVGGFYILANPIDFSSKTLDSFQTAGKCVWGRNGTLGLFHLEGNGYAVNNVKVAFASNDAGRGLFARTSNQDFTISNITFNVSGKLTQNSNGVLIGASGNHYDAGTVTFENVIVNADNLTYEEGSFGRGAAIFFAKPRQKTVFRNCLLTGSFESKSKTENGVGGFVGLADCNKVSSATWENSITFENCKATGSFKLTNNIGARNAVFVGLVNNSNVTVNFINCEMDSNISVQYAGNGSEKVENGKDEAGNPKYKTYTGCQDGGFIALVAAGKAINFVDCSVAGNWSFGGNSSAAYVGQSSAPCTFTNCTFDGTLNATQGKVSAFVGVSSSLSTFENCLFEGDFTSTGAQSGGFIGCINNPGTAMFDSCEADAAVYAKNNRIAFFVGQAYTSGKATLNGAENQTVYMKECTATGTLISSSNWEGAFVGVASGSYNKIGQEATITFDGCTANVFMVASGSVAAYVGSNGNGTAHLNFKNCTNNATIYSVSSAGAWAAEFLDEYPLVKDGTPVESTISVDNDCTNNAKIYSVTLFAGDTTAAHTEITAEQVASGEYAYMIAQAQAAASVDAKYVYGQTIGTDATPKFGGKTVYKFDTNKVGTFYSNNAEYVYTLTEAPKAHVQYSDVYAIVDDETSLEYDAFNARVIIVVSEAKLAEIARVGITLTFKNGDEVVNTKTFGKGGIDSYYAVYADDQIAQAADGYVLVAVTVTGIPTAEWNNGTGTVSVTMEAFDANGDLMPEYTLA